MSCPLVWTTKRRLKQSRMRRRCKPVVLLDHTEDVFSDENQVFTPLTANGMFLMNAFQHLRGVWPMAIFSTRHKTRIKLPSDATMTNLLLININAKSSHCTCRLQVVLDLIVLVIPADVRMCNQSQAISFDRTGAESDTTATLTAGAQFRIRYSRD